MHKGVQTSAQLWAMAKHILHVLDSRRTAAAVEMEILEG